MQSFVILCRFSRVYMASAGAEAGTSDRAIAMLSVEVVCTSTSSDWFDPAEAC